MARWRGSPERRTPSLTAKSYPRCEATLRNGQPCKNVVFSRDSEDELHRRFCNNHAKQAAAAEAKQAADAEKTPVNEPVEDTPLEIPDPAPGEALAEVLAEIVTTTPGLTTPRDAIRKVGLENADLVGRFFADVLEATQQVWVSCPSCKKRSEVAVPNWSARTRALELMLSEAFGKPEAAPLTEDEELLALIRTEMRKLSDETMLAISGLQDFQQRLLALPLDVQMGLSEADDDELVEVAQRRGYALSPA